MLSIEMEQKLLRTFLTDILENHLPQYVQKELEIMKDKEVPLLNKMDLSERELKKQTKENARSFLKNLLEGTAIKTLEEDLIRWEKDEIPGISKDSVQPDDLILIFSAQKQTLSSFIPRFTDDAENIVQLYAQLDEYFIQAQRLAFEKLFEIQKNSERKLQQLNEDLKSFNYSVSHDLRAPLRAVHGYAKIVIEDYEDDLDDEVVDLLNIIMQNSNRMSSLIDDLLEFSRVGRRDVKKQPVDMTKLVNQVVRNQKQEKESANLKVKISQLPKVKADFRMMQQVWTNLVINAIKFTTFEDEPRIKVEGELDDDRVIYSISDNGIGFDMQYKNKLFTVFQRLHSQKKFKGTGIGLSLVKRIIQKHRGHVWAEGVKNKGATFYFSVPN